jgi:hypothetical protein
MRRDQIAKIVVSVVFTPMLRTTSATAQEAASLQDRPTTYALCENPETRQPPPCYVPLEERFSTTRRHEDARALVLCLEGLAATDPENPFVLIHLALAYTHNASYLDAWIALGKAQRIAKTECVLRPDVSEKFNEVATKLNNDLRQIGQAVRLHFSSQGVSDIAIDGTLVAQAVSAELPLTIGGHSFQWTQDGRTCYLHQKIHFDPGRVVRVQLTCNEAQASPDDDHICRRPECNDKCNWSFEQSRRVYPCPSCDRLFHIGEGLVAVGIAGAVGFGLGFGLASHSNQQDADTHCGTAGGFSDPNACTPEGYASDRAARAYAKAQYWSIGVGAATAVAGAALMIPWRKLLGGGTAGGSTGPKETSFDVAFVPVVSPTEAGVSLKTAW